jgi:hypothetical protein
MAINPLSSKTARCQFVLHAAFIAFRLSIHRSNPPLAAGFAGDPVTIRNRNAGEADRRPARQGGEPTFSNVAPSAFITKYERIRLK